MHSCTPWGKFSTFFRPPASCLAPLFERTVEGCVGVKIYKVNGAWIDFCGILMYNGRSEVKNYGLDRKRKTPLYATNSERHDAKTGGGQAGNPTQNRLQVGDGTRIPRRLHPVRPGGYFRRQRKDAPVRASCTQYARDGQYETYEILRLPPLRELYARDRRWTIRTAKLQARTSQDLQVSVLPTFPSRAVACF